MTKLDLVHVLITQYRDRIQPSIPSEVQDIAKDLGVTPEAVCHALTVALDELEYTKSRHCPKCDLLVVMHGHDGECPDVDELLATYDPETA